MSALLDQVAERRLELAVGKHTPSRAMQVIAKRGLQASQKHKISPEALAVGRKVASGQKISDSHVESMASYHAGHEGGCPTGTDQASTEDMLWGGAPGAAWSSARVAAMDASDLADDMAPSLVALAADDKEFSLEIFVRDGLGEPIKLDESDDGLIWAPLLRTGMHATRPGPNGEKLNEPLVVVSGYASDPTKEIGLQNLYDAFQGKAFEHVTIPQTHENHTLDNTGYIVDVKIVESAKRPGEKVFMGAHRFTEPEVRGKVERGSVANRSCGIVYDQVNTETGERWPQALEHVALTNKAWIRGMTPYGEDGFSDDREVVPMMLSEAPAPRRAELATSTSDPWDGSPARFSDQQYARACVLDRGSEAGAAKERYSLPVREPSGTLNANGVHAAAGRISSIKGASDTQKRAAARKLISAYRSLGETAPPALQKLAAASTKMSEEERHADLLLADVQWGDEPSLNSIRGQILAQLDSFRAMGEPGGYPYYYVMDVAAGKALVQCEYNGSDQDDAWVVPYEADSQGVRLADFSQWTPVTQEWVTDEDAAQDKAELGSILGETGLPVPTSSTSPDALSERQPAGLRLSQERSNNQQGGAMKPTTSEVLERLELSDEARAALQGILDPILTENQRLSTKLGEVTKESRKTTVETRVKELQEKGFTPGFCKRYEAIALSDDGQVAATLNLSEDGSGNQSEYTATQIAESLIESMPFDKDSGKLALAEQANLLNSPIGDRPAKDAKEQAEIEGDDAKPKSAEEWLAEAEAASPGVTAGLQLASTTPKEG